MSVRGLAARRLVALAAVTLSLAVSVGCSDSGDSISSLPDSTSPTTETVTAPPLCSAQAVRGSVERFFTAMNEGDVAAADSAVAPTHRFQWFSVDPERLNGAAYDRASLREFLEAQVTTGWQTELISFFASDESRGNFHFRLAQRIGAEQQTEATGKGAVDCGSGLIMVWSVGARESSG